MAIHDMWSYDHALQLGTDISAGSTLTAYSETGTYNQQTGLPGMLYKNTNGTAGVGVDGFLNLNTASGSNPTLLVQAKEVQDWSVATQYWVGFRTKTQAQNGGAVNVFSISDVLAVTNFQALLQESDMTAAGASTLNTEYYVEIFLDRVNHVYQVWIDGKQIKNGTLTAAAMPSGGTGFYWYGGYNSQSGIVNGAARAFRDYYFVDVNAATPGRLGAVRSSMQSISAVTAPNYKSYEGIMVGTAQISTAQTKVNPASLTLGSAAGSTVQVADRPGLRLSTAWTIEAWCYMTGVSSDVVLLDKSASSTASTRSWLEIFNQQVYIKLDGSSAAVAIGPSSGIPGANQWFHIALVQNGSSLYLYINGAQIGVISSTATWGNQAGNLVIGQNMGLTAPNFPGYVQELRISNNARYTAAFTPSTTRLVTDANTMLLMHFDSSAGGLIPDDALTPLATLQQAYGSSTTFTGVPALINAPTDDELDIALSTSYSAAHSILAVDFRLAGRTPNSPATLTSAIKQGSNTTSFGTYTIADGNMNYGRRLGLATTAPDGGAWTPAKISATTVALTPTS